MRSRALRLLASGARGVGLVATFIGALVVGVSVHSNTPAFRRLASEVGNRALGSLFEGKIVVHDVESLSIGSRAKVRVRQAEVIDPEGHRVILADGVEAEIDLRRLLTALATTGAPDVALHDVHVQNAEVVLDVDPAGKPWIARTFNGAHAPAQDGSRPATPSGVRVAAKTEPRVTIDRASIGHARVHGTLVPPSLDGETADLEARFRFENKRIAITVDKGRVTLTSPKIPEQKAPLVAAIRGDLGIGLGGTTTQLDGNVELEGSVGSVPVKARGKLQGDKVEAAVDIPRTEPSAITGAFGQVPLTKPVEIHARADGKLPTIGLSARVRVGESDVVANGEIDVREGKAFKVDVDASHVDAQGFGAPVSSDISGNVLAEGNLAGAAGGLGTFRVTTNEGTLAGEKLPPATIEGRFGPKQVTAVLRAHEPGVDASGNVTLDVPTKIATFDVQGRSDSLRALARAPNKIGGAGSVRARGQVDLAKKTIHANTTVSIDNAAIEGFSAKHLGATGVIDGPLDAPMLDVGFAGVDMQVKARGKAPLVYPSATGRAKIALAPTPHVLDASIDLGKPGAPDSVSASAQGVRIANGAIEARGVRVTGLGEPLELDASIGHGEWHVRAKSSGLDPKRAMGVTGIKELALLPEDTRATLDIDVRQGGADRANGHIDIAIRSEKGLGSGPVAFETHAKIDRGKLVGTSKLVAEGFGQIEIARAEIDVPARLDARSLQRTTGVVEVRGTIDLSQGAALFAGENIERVAGLASFEARIERPDPEALPTIRATTRTAGLEIAIAQEPPARTIEITGIDALAHVAWDGLSDDAEVAFLTWDSHGLLTSAGAKSKVPLAAWVTGAKKIEAPLLAKLDLNAVADVPIRDLADLPPFLGIPALRGKIDGHVDVSGLVGHPTVLVSAHARRVREDQRKRTNAQPSFGPLDGRVDARWDGERGTITVALDERERRTRRRPPSKQGVAEPERRRPKTTPGHLRGLFLLTDLRVNDLLYGKWRNLPWRASGEIEVENLALAAIPQSPQSRMTGLLTGRGRVTSLNGDASFEAKAHIDNFGTGGAQVRSVDVTAGGRDASLFAHASVNDRASQATVQLASQSLHVKGLDVSWDDTAPTRLDYAVQNGRLALVGPLVKRWVSEIDGRVDGAGSVTLDKTSQVFDGGLAVQDARLYVNLLGEEVSSLDAIAKFERTGVFRIDDANGKMGSGEFRASVNGRMSGLRFEGADATLIAMKDGIPISSEGAVFADATGEIRLSAKMSADRNTLLVDVNVPRADISLPDSTQSLQSLDPDPTVTIGVRHKNGKLDTNAVRKARGGTGGVTAKAEENLVTRMSVVLGDNVRLEGRGLDVALGGRTIVELNEELKVTGRIDLRGGSIEVHGRRFTVDHGTVTFPEGGDPGNPTIVARAYWDAPDRTRVWVDYAGPLKGGKLTLSSEPSYPLNEILSVLLFGRPDPNMASAEGGASASGSATAVGTGFFAADVNRALSEIDENLDIETDTLSGNRWRAKLGRSFFDRRLKVQFGLAPGRANYRDPDTGFLFLNWQFVPKWSVQMTGGNTGTTILDVLFQHRY